MSLISDALKTAQRERTGRAQSAKDPQPLLDGFFPYVSSSPSRSRSRLMPLVWISAVSLVLLAVAGWFMVPMLTGSKLKARSPILLPPSSVAQTPVVTDSAVVQAPDRQDIAADAPGATDPAPQPVSRPTPPRRGAIPEVRAPMRTADVRSSRVDTNIVPAAEVGQRAPLVARPEALPTRVDYEAQATALFNAGDFAGARERFQLAVRFAPTARAWTNYGVTLQKLGDLSGASAAYQSAIGIDANYLEAWLYQGRLAVQLGDVAKAIPMFQRARAINPRHADVNVELARLESEAKNWTETRRFAEDAVRGDPSNARAHWYLAVATDQLKDFEVAAREYAAYLQTVGAAERDQAQFVGWARQRLAELRGKS